jgi:colicin import membrane protein
MVEMRVSPIARLGLTGLIALIAAMPVRAENAAHDIANKFSETTSKAAEPQDDLRRKTYEAEMLESARQEARERAEAELRAAAEVEARRKDMEAQREAESLALADKLKRAQDARKAKAADASEEKSFKPALTNTDKAAVKPATGAAEAPIVVKPPMASTQPAEVARKIAPGPAVPALAPPVAAPQAGPATDIASEPAQVLPPPMALGRPVPTLPPIASAPADPRVTILLVMEPGTKGIRRFNKTADPVICEGTSCFVSNGAGAPARVMALRKTLGPGNTFGKRAGACRGKLACVFRGVTLTGAAPTIQPVDLKVLVHDRREARTVSGDASCRVIATGLACGRTVVAQGYRAWIVPESVAELAGPAALDAAVLRGLVANPLREAAISR